MKKLNIIWTFESIRIIGLVVFFLLGAFTLITTGCGGGGGDEPSCDQITADPGGPYHGYNDRWVTFYGLDSCSPSNIVSWQWDFGDGSVGEGPTPEAYYGPCEEGTVINWTVTLTITDDAGNKTTGQTIATISCIYSG